MAIGKKGINGNFSGKVGSIIGYELGGQQVIRSVGSRTKPFSVLERLNHARMKAVSTFLRPILPFLKIGFHEEALKNNKRVGAFQAAQSYTYRNALDYDTDNQPYVNPAKVLISKGLPCPAADAKMEWKDGVLTLQWRYERTIAPEAQLILLLYDGTFYRKHKVGGTMAEAEIHIWEIGELTMRDGPIHVYGWFKDLLFNRVSDSVYFGSIS